MATQQANPLQVRGLGREKTAALAERAKRLGMTPQRYLKHLVEEDLAISGRAKKEDFGKLLGPGRQADEAEVDRIVEEAKIARHGENSKKG
jgi:hypothetical protein